MTARGKAVLLASVVAYAVGEWAGHPLLRALAGAAFGAVLTAVALTARRPRVTVTREVYPDRVRRGQPAVARLRVRNPGPGRQGGFTAGDRVGAGFHAVAVRELPSGQESVQHYDLPTDRRGRHQVGPLTLERVDPLGLGRGRLTTGDTTTLWVHPRHHPVRALAGGHPRHHHEGRTTENSPHGSLDLRDVREYVVGDEVRHLHWRATARTGRLMVRDYVDPEQPRFTALLDTRGDVLDGPVFEEAVDLVASLLTASALAGHRSRLVTSCGRDLPAGTGAASARRLLDELSEVDRSHGDDLPLVPPPFTRSALRGGSLVVVTAGVRPADVVALATLRPRYSATVVIALAGRVDVPGATVVHATDAADAARRWNLGIAR